MRTIAAQSGRSQVETIHTTSFLRPSACGIVFPLGVHMGVDWLLARSHGLREHGVHVAIGGTGLEHRSPVNFASMIGVGARHDGTLVGVLYDRRIYLLERRMVNIPLLVEGGIIGTRLHEVRILLGRGHPRSLKMCLTTLTECRTRTARIGGRGGFTHFILNWFGSIGGLRTLQVGLGMRQMRGTRGVTAS